jgi:N-methylhydantoinase A/oxoprolinase/acetone carboxylase beta subunit
MSSHYLLGVDTGGTYTDAAVIEPEGHRVVASAKALTTKGDLAIGVADAITAAMAKVPAREVALVSVSTTLATNAVVEGHGSAVGVILIGFDDGMAERTGIAKAFPGIPIARIAGGHDHNGDERAGLDLAALGAAIETIAPLVEAFAVASGFAVRNPAHEHRARDLVIEKSGKPVTLSTELSSALDAPRRALTATLNARLISRVSSLIDAVGRAMAALGISCPLMIVKGDGTLARAGTVARRPIETVLSGPAASLVGARWLSGLDDFIMSDMGGTTTDLGILVKGKPQVTEEGAEVGGWRTMVKAIDVKTIGLGGDSEVAIVTNGALTVGPQRIVPVSLIGERFPEVLAMLEADIADTEGGSQHGRFVMRPLGSVASQKAEGLAAREAEILATISDRPKPLRRIAVSSGAQRALASLRKRGLVQLCGFTPSDASHVLNLQANWSRQAAVLAAQLLLRFRTMKLGSDEEVDAFAREVWNETVRLTGRAIIATAFGRDVAGEALVDAVCAGRGSVGRARVALSPMIPVVAVGGPVRVYYGEVGRRLGCEIVYPEYCDVANAVGAATGVVACTVAVHVEGDGSGLFHVHGPEGPERFGGGPEALARAEALGRAAARTAAIAMGAGEPDIRVTVEKHMLPDSVDENGLFRAVVSVDAVGRPVHA